MLSRVRQGRSANGTLTLRRSSTTPLSQASQTPVPSENAVVQPPAPESALPAPSVNDSSPFRYTRDHLLDLYTHLRAAEDPSRLYMAGWNPAHVNGSGSRAWGKSNENHVPQEPGACWDPNGDSTPMGHHSLNAEEKEVCIISPTSATLPVTHSPSTGHLNRHQLSVKATNDE